MKKTISLNTIEKRAKELFLSGSFYCSEAIVYVIREQIDPTMPKEIINVASGFPVGVGKSKCMCGAVSGGVIVLGYFFGRNEPGTPLDNESQISLELTNELQKFFRDNFNNVLCCHIQTKGMDMSSGEHKQQCADFTAIMAKKTAKIIAREYSLVNLD